MQEVPQTWTILSPQTRQRQEFIRLSWYRPWHGDDDDSEKDTNINFWSKLADDDLQQSGIHKVRGFLKRWHDAHESRPQTSVLSSLPLELLTLVADRLEKRDIISLAMTCHSMMSFGLDNIKARIFHTPPIWAGKSLAVLGTYLTDLPPAFFQDGLAYKSVSREDLISLDIDNGMSFSPRRFHHWPARQYLWTTTYDHEEGGYGEVDATSELSRWSAELEEFTLLSMRNEQVSHTLMSIALQERHGGICGVNKFYLRNLLTKELVRVCNCRERTEPHIVNTSREITAVEESDLLSLDIVLLNRLRWASKAGRLPQNQRKTSGPWAGHSFDIVSTAIHEKQCDDQFDEWTDVTKQVWEYEANCDEALISQ